MLTYGSRRQVWNKTAKKTRGGLVRNDLFKKNGRIKSKRASKKAKRNNNLKKAGWTFKKGEFGAIRIEDKGKRGSSKKKKKSSKKKKKTKKKNYQRGGSITKSEAISELAEEILLNSGDTRGARTTISQIQELRGPHALPGSAQIRLTGDDEDDLEVMANGIATKIVENWLAGIRPPNHDWPGPDDTQITKNIKRAILTWLVNNPNISDEEAAQRDVAADTASSWRSYLPWGK